MADHEEQEKRHRYRVTYMKRLPRGMVRKSTAYVEAVDENEARRHSRNFACRSDILCIEDLGEC